MSDKEIPSFKDNLPDWYQYVVDKAGLAEHSPVKGCMTIRPYGQAIWDLLKDQLNDLIVKHGAKNCSFPLFIPYSYLSREKEHVEGFSPEIAVVTHAGGKELAEPLVVRPTSETIIHESMRRWINSYRDLPMKLNQWCNVVRWEKHPRLFLRTSEFQWQEGHTAHATEQEARQEVASMVELYFNFIKDVLAIPTVKGQKSEKEKFAGAVDSYSVEALMPDNKAVQMGTIHYLGLNFSKIADVKFVDESGAENFVYMTSWGVSTRLIGALIMTHGDEKGLCLSPKVAPTQVVIVPIGNTLKQAKNVAKKLETAGVRIEIDERDDIRPGAKFYYHELRGVPIRLEIGERELAENKFNLAIRYSGEKLKIEANNVVKEIKSMLDTIQKAMLTKAEKYVNSKVVEAKDKADFEKKLASQVGFVKANWCGEPECEAAIKEATTANSRNIPFSENKGKIADCKCIWCGKKAKVKAYFAKSY